MIVGTAVLPHPPLLLLELTGGLDAGAALRRACAEALDEVLARDPDEVVVVGGSDLAAGHDSPAPAPAPAPAAGLDVAAYGSFAPHLPTPAHRLPLSLGVGARLLDEAGWRGPRVWREVPPDLPTAACLDLGRELAGRPGRTALLVMGDGSACRSTTAPGYLDERAVPFDTVVTEALATGDAAALEALDPVLAADLLAAGRAAWQVLAGAMPGAEARLLTAQAPHGVLYLVGTWVPGRRA